CLASVVDFTGDFVHQSRRPLARLGGSERGLRLLRDCIFRAQTDGARCRHSHIWRWGVGRVLLAFRRQAAQRWGSVEDGWSRVAGVSEGGWPVGAGSRALLWYAGAFEAVGRN